MCGIIERIMQKTLRVLIVLLCAAAHPTWGFEDTVSKAMKATGATDYDLPPFKDRSRSLIRWDDADAALDIKRWIAERDLRDQEPGWKVRQRLAAQPEGVGKVISCIGDCRIYRGLYPSKARWLSRILEGDEIHTGVNSYLWMALLDGTLVRVAPESSLSMLEVNITPDEVFFQARLNQGYVHWQPRTGRTLKPMTAPETDPLFLPLMDPKVNLEWFQRALYTGQTDKQQILFTTAPSILGYDQQQKVLSSQTKANNKFMDQRGHRFMLVCPNGTLLAKSVAVSLFYGLAKRSFFKVSTFNDDQEGDLKHRQHVEFLFRGYSNDKTELVTNEEWNVISEDGRSMAPLASVPPELAISDFMTKRIPTFMLARERWLASEKAFWEDAAKPETLAINWGYRLWGSELERRISYLKEYTRRIETTALRSIDRLVKETRRENDPVMGEFDSRYFARALDHYYLTLKRRHTHSRESARDMSYLHYYGWMLRNGRQQ